MSSKRNIIKSIQRRKTKDNTPSFMRRTGKERFIRDTERSIVKSKKEEKIKKQEKEKVKKSKIKQAEERRKESIKDIVIAQPKSPKKRGPGLTGRGQREIDKLIKRAERGTKELKQTGEELKESKMKERQLIQKKIIRKFRKVKNKNDIIFANEPEIKQIIAEAMQLQRQEGRQQINICREFTKLAKLAEEEAQTLNSIVSISGSRVFGILTYIEESNNIKIETLCSAKRTQGVGSKLLRELENKFPGVTLKLDSVEEAVSFYTERGFEIVGESGGTTQMIKER